MSRVHTAQSQRHILQYSQLIDGEGLTHLPLCHPGTESGSQMLGGEGDDDGSRASAALPVDIAGQTRQPAEGLRLRRRLGSGGLAEPGESPRSGTMLDAVAAASQDAEPVYPGARFRLVDRHMRSFAFQAAALRAGWPQRCSCLTAPIAHAVPYKGHLYGDPACRLSILVTDKQLPIMLL